MFLTNIGDNIFIYQTGVVSDTVNVVTSLNPPTVRKILLLFDSRRGSLKLSDTDFPKVTESVTERSHM